MIYNYLVSIEFKYAPSTGNRDRIFKDKRKAFEYYKELRKDFKDISKIVENTNNIYGNFNREDCWLTTTLYRKDSKLAVIQLRAIEVGD